MKTLLARLLIAALIPLLAACATAATNESPTAVAKEKIKAGALIVDVRTPDEFSGGHYAGAKNIPFTEVEARIAEFGDKSKPIVVYCRSGNRSGRAKLMLEKAGYTDVTNGGGLSDMPK